MKSMIFGVVLTLGSTVALGGWDYKQNIDKMSSKQTLYAIIKSENSLNLSSPYSGRNHGHLTVRQHPTYGQNVIFQVDQGQIMCNSYNGCPIIVRFDEKPAVTFSGTEAADNDPKTVFISNSSRFIGLAKTAKRILVQVNLFHNGNPVLEFTTQEPLQWGKKIVKGK